MIGAGGGLKCRSVQVTTITSLEQSLHKDTREDARFCTEAAAGMEAETKAGITANLAIWYLPCLVKGG